MGNFFRSTLMFAALGVTVIPASAGLVTVPKGEFIKESEAGSALMNGNENAKDLVQTVGMLAQVVPGVPEPSTWVLMLLGFGAVGFAGYRAKQRRESIAA